MLNLMAFGLPPGIFDAAAKVTSSWALGAFGIAATVAIFLGNSKKKKFAGSQFPIAAVVVIVTAILVPVAGAAIMASFPDTPYRVTVTVEDKAGSVVSDPHVTSSVGGQQSRTEGGVLIEIPPSSIPTNSEVTFWADKGGGGGKSQAKFGRGRSVAVTVTLAETVASPDQHAKAETPKPKWCDQSPAGAPFIHVEDFWPHEHLNGKVEGGDTVNPGRGWYYEWQAPGPVYDVQFAHDGSHMEKLECGPVLGKDTVAFCHGGRMGAISWVTWLCAGSSTAKCSRS